MNSDFRAQQGLVEAAWLRQQYSNSISVLRQLLCEYMRSRGETRMARTLLRYTENHPDIADRRATEGHLTASVVIIDDRNRCLLTLHRKYKTWQQLGGHADGNYDLVAVAAKEGIEESGLSSFGIDPVPIDVDIHDAGCGDEHTRHFDVCFAGRVSTGESIRRSDESIDLKWLKQEDIRRLGVAPRLLTLVDRAITDITTAEGG